MYSNELQITPRQVWKSKSLMDGRRVKIVGIDPATGKVKLEWRPSDPTFPYTEIGLTEFVQKYEPTGETA